MEKIEQVIKGLEERYNSINLSNEERELMRAQRVLDEVLAIRNAKQEQKLSVLKEFEYWIQVKEKHLELPDVKEKVEIDQEGEAENA